MYIFYDLVFSWNVSNEKSVQRIYSKHDAFRSMKQGSCIIKAVLFDIGVYVSSVLHVSRPRPPTTSKARTETGSGAVMNIKKMAFLIFRMLTAIL